MLRYRFRNTVHMNESTDKFEDVPAASNPRKRSNCTHQRGEAGERVVGFQWSGYEGSVQMTLEDSVYNHDTGYSSV